jgi:hypothetical protein
VLHLHERAIFYYSIVAVLLGAQFMAIGFLAELMTAYLGGKKGTYSVRERVGQGFTARRPPSGVSPDSACARPFPGWRGRDRRRRAPAAGPRGREAEDNH